MYEVEVCEGHTFSERSHVGKKKTENERECEGVSQLRKTQK